MPKFQARQREGKKERLRKLAPPLLPSRRHHGQPWTLVHVVPSTRAQEGYSYFLQMYTCSSVYPASPEVCPSTDPMTQLILLRQLHSMSAHSPFRRISNTLSPQSLVTNVLQHINILSQCLKYPNGTALSGWGHMRLRAVATQPKASRLGGF